MNKEEILEKSRIENKGKDVADAEIARRGVFAGWTVTVCLAMAAAVADAIVFGRPAFESLFAVTAGLAVVFFSKYVKLKKKHELVVAICYSVGAGAFLCAWLLQLLHR